MDEPHDLVPEASPSGPFPSAPPAQVPRPITSFRWGVGAAVWLTLLTGGITLFGGVIGGLLQDYAREVGLSESAYGVLMVGVLCITYALIILTVWLAARRRHAGFAGAVGLHPAPIGEMVRLGLGVALGARFVTGIYGVALQALGVELPVQEFDPTQLLPHTALGVAFTVLLAVVLAPLAEEIVFRGVLLSALRDRWGDAFAIGASSAVFAAAHVMPFAMPPIFLLSVALGWMYVRARTLWAPIAAHAIFNGIGIAALYLLQGAGVL